MKQNQKQRRKQHIRVGLLVSCWESAGGVIRVACQLANRLSNDAEVHLIALHGTARGCAFPIDSRVHRKCMLQGEGERLSGYLKHLHAPLRRYCQDNDLDILLFLGTYPGVMGIIPGWYYGVKTVFCDHGALENQLADKQITLIRRIASLVCARTVVLTHKNAEAYFRRFHRRRAKVVTIPNWIPTSLVKKCPEYDDRSKKALWVGRLDPEKGIDHLIDIIDYIQHDVRRLGWRIDVFGQSVLGGVDDIESQLAVRHIDDLICLKGSIDDIYDRYERYGIFLLTSYREGLPLSLLESQACGVPGISFDVITGPSDIITDGVNGRLIAPYDIKAFGDALLALMQNVSVRKEMAYRTRSSVEPFFEDSIYVQWISLIYSLV